MKGNDKRAFEASRRAEGWADANADAVPPEVAGQVAALRAANAAVALSATRQEHETRSTFGATVALEGLRKELRTLHLAPLGRVARAVVHLSPELRAKLRVPGRDSNDETLIAAAEAMAQIGKENEPLLVDHGLPPDFVAQLDAATAALKDAVDARGQMRSRRAGATRSVHEQVLAGQRAVQALDVALARVLRTDSARFAEWRTAKRVVVKGTRSASDTPGSSGTTTPAAPAAPTA